MITDVIRVSSRGRRMEQALLEADKVAQYKGLSHKGALQLRLLTEETMGLLRSITGETEADFWIEEKQGEYELHLKTETRMNSVKRENLLAASTSGKNESAKGLMGRLRDFFDRGEDADLAGYTSTMMLGGEYDAATSPLMDWAWSLSRYEEQLAEGVDRREADALAAWDELEKSVVKNVADDVKVGIRNDVTEMIIVKKLA